MRAWLSKDAIPSRSKFEIELPDDELWMADFLGAFLSLTEVENWESIGSLTPAEMAEEWLSIFLLFANNQRLAMPVGSIVAFAGADIPDGWLLCNGQAVSRTAYADLFSLLQLTYGFGDGSTTFNVPDLRGRVPVGRDAGIGYCDFLGEWGGEEDHELSLSELANHNHTQDAHNHTQNAHNHTQDAHNHTQDAHNHTQNAHNHTQDAHNHTQNAHNHFATFTALAAVGTARSIISSFAPGIQAVADQTAINQASTPTNQAATAINQASTPTNQAATAINQASTPTNQAATATNQATGSGLPHNNLQPYLTLNFIIKF